MARAILCVTVLVTALSGVPKPGWAVSSFALTSSDLLSTTGFLEATSVSPTSGLTFSTVTVGTVTLALEIEEMKPSAQSPHHNLAVITGGVENTVTAMSNVGMVTIQQVAGGANVTMALTNILVGGGVISSAPSALATADPTVALVGLLNQPFTVTNSYWFAQTLNKSVLVDAFVSGSASPTNAIAEDVVTVGLNEFSPHHNVGRADTGLNAAQVSGNLSMGPVQQTAGFANVQESMNTILIGTGTLTLGTNATTFLP
jgi:hypothetical protein